MEKTIHYCWFGRKPLPKLAKKCIKSWKKYLPDYEIKEWNEENFDITCCRYVREAYEAKKYAFVSDYVRFYILYNYGGLYFDTDVELIKPLDEIIERGNFLGCETDAPNITVAAGLGMGAEKGLELYATMLKQYVSDVFVKEDGTYNLNNVVTRMTNELKKLGLLQIEGIQNISDITIYPKEYFNPCDMQTGRICCTDKTYSIHHYAASWVSKKDRIRGKAYQILSRLIGKKAASKIKNKLR